MKDTGNSKETKQVQTGAKPTKTPEKDASVAELTRMVKGLTDVVTDLATRLERVETGGANDFQKEATVEDIAYASEIRKDIDPKTCSVVDEILGADFGIRMVPNKDNPGFLFSIVVPERLSDRKIEQRPVKAQNGKYKKDQHGNVVYEEYKPEDVRSKMLTTAGSYDTIRDFCNKVRANIVAYYQKTKKPLPEFKVK